MFIPGGEHGLQGFYFLGIPTQYLYSLFEATPPIS